MNNITAMIPARIGSQRLTFKNLCLVNNKPLIYYCINAAKKSKVFDKIVLNSDDIIFKKIAQRYKVDFFLRPKKFGKNNTKSDDVVFNFLQNYKTDILVWVNPIAPLLTYKDIKKIINYFEKSNFESLYTVVDRKVHSIFRSKNLNFVVNSKFQQTQNLNPVKEMVYTLMMWKTKIFLKNYSKFGYAFLNNKVCFYPVSSDTSYIVKNIDDLRLVESIIKSKNSKYKIKYDKILKK